MRTKNELARITIDLPLELQKKLKILSAIKGTSMREIIIKSLEQKLKTMEKKMNGNLLQQEE